MPELPEVETIVNDLAKKIIGKTIKKIEIVDNKTINIQPNLFIKLLNNEKVVSVKRRAKLIIMKLRRDYLTIHLKMTGQLVFVDKKKVIAGGHTIKNIGKDLPNKYSRLIIEFKDKSCLYFNDQRRFGWVKLFKEQELKCILDKLGIEPLDKEFDFFKFKLILKHKKRSTIKQTLLDQKIIAGIGNIYTDESLFEAGINPSRRVDSLKDAEIKKLLQAIRKKLKLAIKYRGTIFNNYIDTKGDKGNFSRFLKVYGRAGERCKKCGSIILKIKLGGRGTHYCPKCQK